MSIIDNETWRSAMRDEDYITKGTEVNFAMEDFLVEGDVEHFNKFKALDEEMKPICERIQKKVREERSQ